MFPGFQNIITHSNQLFYHILFLFVSAVCACKYWLNFGILHTTFVLMLAPIGVCLSYWHQSFLQYIHLISSTHHEAELTWHEYIAGRQLLTSYSQSYVFHPSFMSQSWNVVVAFINCVFCRYVPNYFIDPTHLWLFIITCWRPDFNLVCHPLPGFEPGSPNHGLTY